MYFFAEIIQIVVWFLVFCVIFLVLISPVIALTNYIKRKSSDFGLKNNLMVKLVFGIVLFIFVVLYLLGLCLLINEISEKTTCYRLSKYNPAITYLENYKTQHGKYPEKFDFNKYVKKRYKEQSYEAKDNSKDYIIKVGDYLYLNSYNYCSNPKYEQCYPHEDSSCIYKQLGKWIEFENID